MSDILEATESSIDRPVSGTMRKFKFLNAYDRAELLRADLKQRQDARAERKQKLIENLKLASATSEQIFSELEGFDDAFPVRVTQQDWIDFVNDPLNDVVIYTRSLAAIQNAEEVAKGADLSLADKAKICGLSVVASGAEENPMKPVIPPTYSNSGTPETTSTGESQAA